MNKKYFSRRHFLRSSTSMVALPILPSLGFNRHAHAAKPKSNSQKKRVVFIGFGYGVSKNGWYPDVKKTGYDYKITECLEPLAPHKKDFTVIQNLQHSGHGDGHSGSTWWLTGADRYKVPGVSFYNSISVDQIAAEEFGKHTRFSSITLGHTNETSSGHGAGSISWNRKGKPITPIAKPVHLYHKLFSEESMSLEERKDLLAKERSVLDSLLSDARSLQKNISREDADKLDEYFDSIRNIEVRLAKEEQWMEIPKRLPSKQVNAPSDDGLTGEQAFKIMIDLMIAAMEVDASRAFAYKAPTNDFIKDMVDYTSHTISHQAGTEVIAASTIRDRAYVKMYRYFIEKLKETKEEDGSSLFDHTTLVQGSNLRLVHSLDNCPTLITGNGSGFKHGRHLVMNKGTNLCNLWLSILKGSGVNVDSFGDSTGVIDELFRST